MSSPGLALRTLVESLELESSLRVIVSLNVPGSVSTSVKFMEIPSESPVVEVIFTGPKVPFFEGSVIVMVTGSPSL